MLHFIFIILIRTTEPKFTKLGSWRSLNTTGLFEFTNGTLFCNKLVNYFNDDLKDKILNDKTTAELLVYDKFIRLKIQIITNYCICYEPNFSTDLSSILKEINLTEYHIERLRHQEMTPDRNKYIYIYSMFSKLDVKDVCALLDTRVKVI